MNVINFTEFLKLKLIKKLEKNNYLTRPKFYQRTFGAGIPNFTCFVGFIDTFVIFETSNCDEILIEKVELERFLISQERLGQNINPLLDAIEAMKSNLI